MAYRSSSQYFEDIRLFIVQLEEKGKSEASNRMKECFDFINSSIDDWKMFYKKLVFMRDEFSFKFTKDENIKLDEIIEAAKRVVFKL